MDSIKEKRQLLKDKGIHLYLLQGFNYNGTSVEFKSFEEFLDFCIGNTKK